MGRVCAGAEIAPAAGSVGNIGAGLKQAGGQSGGLTTPAAGTRRITVIVAECSALFRAALAAGLEDQRDVAVVATIGDSAEAVDAILTAQPDVAIVDSGLTPHSGVEVCASLKALDVRTKILILSNRSDQSLLLAAVEAGADGYVDRSSDLLGLVSAIRRVHAGEACIPPEMLGVLLRHLIERRRGEDVAVDRFSRLSRREREVFALLVQGMDNRAIAEALVVSPHTSRTHIQRVLEKLGVHSRLEAVFLASRYNLIERFGGVR